MRQAEAGVKIAQLKVDIAIAGSREEQIRTAKAKVKQSRAQKTGSQKALDNAILLYSQRTPQKTQVDIAKAQKDVLETQKSGTEKLLDNAEEVLYYSPETDTLENQLEIAELQLEQAEELADNTSQAATTALDYYNYLLALWPGTTDTAKMQLINSSYSGYMEALGQYEAAKNAVDQAELAIEGIEQALDNAENLEELNQESQVDLVQNQIDVIGKQLEGTQKSLENAEELYNDRTGAQQLVDSARTQHEISKAVEEAAQAQLDLLESGVLPENIEILKAQLEQANALLDQSLINLNKASITSPIKGIISNQFFEEGELITPGSPLFTVSNLEKISLTVYVEEIDLGKVKVNQDAEISVDSFPDRIFKGKVIQIATEAEFTPSAIQTKDERATTVYAVTIKVQNENSVLKSGMPADAIIITE